MEQLKIDREWSEKLTKYIELWGGSFEESWGSFEIEDQQKLKKAAEIYKEIIEFINDLGSLRQLDASTISNLKSKLRSAADDEFDVFSQKNTFACRKFSSFVYNQMISVLDVFYFGEGSCKSKEAALENYEFAKYQLKVILAKEVPEP